MVGILRESSGPASDRLGLRGFWVLGFRGKIPVFHGGFRSVYLESMV